MSPAPQTQQFNALVLDETDGKVSHSFKTLNTADLPDGDVTVAVEYSSLNYKDGMIISGIGKLVRNYPHIPGVDFAGTVETSDSPNFKPGDNVVCTGWRVGEAHWGGYATRARVKSDWLVKLPSGLDAKRAMAIGTAGLTAALAVMALQEHGLSTESEGEVLITGAAGGVGSVAVALLANLGYRVAAGTGRGETHEYLKDLGAAEIITRDELQQAPRGPLASERWSGAIDNVGGPILANLLASLKYGASCAAVGLAASPNLETTVLPFLLRGVNLLGIDSVHCPNVRRLDGWGLLAKSLPMEKLDAITNVSPMADLPELAGQILKGQVKGRVVIDVNS
ncbi:MAG: oxidoreductase [Rhodospirillaceae bacterium]|nr:oxidoreductase [Rhodospirillaceae bacterium]